MRRRLELHREAACAAALALLSLVLALGQRRGVAYTDTRIELTVDPLRFLRDAGAVWSPSTDLGHVQSGQFVGYLFPQGPFFSLIDLLGLPAWLVERLWLALLLFVSAWGAVRVVGELVRPRLGAPHVVAAIAFMASPYAVVQGNRATASLLAYAALPWLLVAVHRALREPTRWRWPAVMALAIAAASGGTNAATVFWVAAAPVALALYEVVVLRRPGRAALAVGWRSVLLATAASLWWVVPVLLAGSNAPDLLAFTEQPRAIWQTSSMAESLRLMGFWLSYFSGGFDVIEPASAAVRPYLTSTPVILATFVVPLLALAGVLLGRRRPYAAFLGLVTVAALFVMAAGYPADKPATGALADLYYSFPAVQFLRTTYKAGAVAALGLAVLAGIAVDELLRRRVALLARRPSRLLRVAPLALVPVLLLWGAPLFTGQLIERSALYGEVPAAWPRALADAERTGTPDGRTMVLPGQLFSAFRWGRTFTPLAPALTDRPTMQRNVVRYADPRSAQLQDAVDDLVQQRRLVPGQLPPLLDLMSVDQVLVGADGFPGQSGEAPPAAIAQALEGQPGLDRADAAFGRVRAYLPPKGEPGAAVALPDVRRSGPRRSALAAVRLRPAEGATVLDGDGFGLAALAADGRLERERAVPSAGDLDRSELAELVRAGARLVFTDANRRRIVNASQIARNAGPTLQADEPIPRGRASYRLFPERGTDAQTVAVGSGLARLTAPGAGTSPVRDDERPFAAFDGRLATTWQPQRTGGCKCLDVTFARPVAVRRLRVHPDAFPGGNLPLGVRLGDGPERRVRVAPRAWTTIRLPGGRPVRRLRLTVRAPLIGTYGLDEVQVPGLVVRQALRLPVTLARTARGLDLARTPLAVELERTTADVPQRAGDDRDPELALERLVTLPVARRFALAGWATASSAAPDPALDRLAGLPAGWRFTSSGRYQGVPGRRASAAFDGDPRTAWMDDAGQDDPPWLAVSAPRPVTVRRLRLVRGAPEAGFASRVDLEADADDLRDLPVGADGTVRLPRPVRTRSLRLEVSEAEAPGAGAIGRQAQVRQVEAHPRALRRLAEPRDQLQVLRGDALGLVRIQRPLAEAIDRRGQPALGERPCRVERVLDGDAGDITAADTPGGVAPRARGGHDSLEPLARGEREQRAAGAPGAHLPLVLTAATVRGRARRMPPAVVAAVHTDATAPGQAREPSPGDARLAPCSDGPRSS